MDQILCKNKNKYKKIIEIDYYEIKIEQVVGN